ncbi:ABC transporter substrate-binding protein [Cereibacter azotoformans]|uniref:Dipeptide transport system substrate-binding protein n=1 Tax=Cereibacter azotoformans TaxID=43057 RepID=A0A2T5K6E5_9RHOB|nr:ABC transporter substrate-binding protein [Cereibacter azotoformans]AXQ95870.1 ABC transporter substrate-binding protein [Cereibacter sphaeroides]PTR17995.1 dipeptide transport system substrate-binding protein [Cereibacter azotoformans]UIJ32616.1 ABC transporter substrate-binding protein [Cereibacter azotoformans]
MRFAHLLAASSLALMAAAGAHAKTLVYCSEGSPEGFDAAPYTSGTTFDAASQTVYNQLVEFKPGTTEIAPGLAESYEISDDGLEYTFRLRPGVKFHTTDFFTPTRDLNADDVIFSFLRQGDEENPWHQYVTGITYEYYSGMEMPTVIKEIQKVDDLTVKFVLTRPEAPFLANLAMDFASILSKEYADKLEAENRKEDLNNAPVGTGPFKFVAYQKDAVIRYQAHDDYWAGREKIDDLIFAITPDPAVRMQKLQAGECHIMPYPAPADIEALKADPNLQVMEQPGLNVAYLAYNTTIAPFDNPDVRRALNMALNKEAVLDAVFQGTGQVAKNPIPPTMWSYNDAVEENPYDPEAAKALLAEAGVSDLSMEIWAMPVQRPYMPNARRTAELMQEDLAKIGVNVEIVSYEWGEYLKKSTDPARKGAVILGWTGDNGDPDNFLGVLLGCAATGDGGANRAQWCNKEFDDLIQKAKVTADQDERAKLYEEAQLVFKRENPWATIAHSTVFMPMSKKVSGYVMNPLGKHGFSGVDIEE